jgi:hypothetical protein
LHDPEFVVKVNGKSVPLTNLAGFLSEKTLKVTDKLSVKVLIFDTSKSARKIQYQGVAFWVGQKLVGRPGWILNGKPIIDGRTAVAKRYTVIVKSDSLYEEVEPDWSGFKKSPIIDQVYEKLLEYLDVALKNLFRGQTREASVEVLKRHLILSMHP